jgi:arylsulfatase A-like enzyme/Flp pilus assembly protein TadD
VKLKLILLGGAALILAAVALFVSTPRRSQANLQPVPRQNVLLVTVDTLRADALGAYGGPAATPAIDQLAADGVRFDFAHAHSVLTLPSHASILTGQYPFQHGVRDNSGYRLPSNTVTAAALFKKAGYDTAAFVSAFPVSLQFGLGDGFDRYDDTFGEAGAPADFSMSERPASAVVPLAQKWLAGRSPDRPWFMWLHVFDPHAPYRPPPPFDTQYAGRAYHGEVAAVDAVLAALLDDVRKGASSTLVVLTSDHGEGLGEHGEDAHGIFAYESTLRVPLIISALGAAAPKGGSREVSPVAARHVDLLPTMLEATGQPSPAGLPGRSLLPASERVAGAEPRPMYFEAMAGMLNHGWAPLSGVIVGRDKFIDLPIVERYDLEQDASERVNIAGRDAARDRALSATLASFSPALPGLRRAEDKDAAARLGSLGYATSQAPAKSKYTEADDPKRLIEIDQMVHRALTAFGEGRLIEAEDIYREIIRRRPDMSVAYRHLAFIEWQAGNGDAAVAVLHRGLSQGVTDPRARAQLGEYLVDMGDVAAGLGILEPLGRSADADADTLNALAIGYARAGRLADARKVFERLAALMPAASAPLENLGVLALQDRDLARAAGYFDRAIAANPQSWRAENGRAAIAFERGDRAAAYAAWERALALAPENVDALFSLGMNLARDGRAAEARSYLERFLRIAPPAMAAERREAERLLRLAR